MKIAYLANVRFPSERAHAVQIAHMCEAFSQNGTEVELIVNNRSNVLALEAKKYFNFEPSFKISRIASGYFSPKLKLSYYVSELLFSISFLLTKKYREYDVIYCRSEWIVWFLSLVLPNKKLIWESHEARLNLPARRLLKKGIKTVVISEGIFDVYEKHGVPHTQMLIAHDGIDDTFFTEVESKEVARTSLGLRSDKKIAMYVGGFDAWKGVETFCAAAKDEAIQFVAIGGKAEEIERLRIKYPLVTFLGQRPYGKLKDNQQAADVLVVPNSGKEVISSSYTSPLKLFAHMASGIPLAVSDLPSLINVTGRDLVTICTPDDPSSLYAALNNILQNYEVKLSQAQELKKHALEYTWFKRAKGILAFIV